MLNSLTLPSYLLAKSQGGLDIILNPFQLYTIPLEQWVTAAVDFLVNNFRPIFQAIRFPISLALQGIDWVFLFIPPLIMLIIIGLIAWRIAGRGIAIYSIIALTFIGFLGAWEQAMVTLSLVVTSVLFCVVVGIPVGIACASSDRLERFVRPILDAMQTLPLFVYLVPIVMLFGIGQIPGVIVTVIVAVPPLIRLTNLGIRQVSPEVVEAAVAFGSTQKQVLWEALLPLATPTILAGMNQTIMMALGMVVVASMISVEGLGMTVLQGVQSLNVGLAFQGGLGIVLITIMLDRITQSLGKPNNHKHRNPSVASHSDLSTKTQG